MPEFERVHHQRIARLLGSLDADLLRTDQCWFGGGTAIALTHGEYRESMDVDFMVSEQSGYRDIRGRLVGARTLEPVTLGGCEPVVLQHEVRADQYGVRMFALVAGVPVKLEIVREARIAFARPGRADHVGDISTLSRVDMAASKLLANSDRGLDRSVFSRDVLDLAMLDLTPKLLKRALAKAAAAYGNVVVSDLDRALRAVREHPDWLLHCMQALAVRLPPAAVQQALRRLARRLEHCTAT